MCGSCSASYRPGMEAIQKENYPYQIRAGSATIIVSRTTGGANNTYYVTQDHLGSAAVITDSTGAVLVKESFAAYGGPPQ